MHVPDPIIRAIGRGDEELALTGEVLINGLDAGSTSPELTRTGYSEENYRKLVAIKDKYDPANVFRFNHNIAGC